MEQQAETEDSSPPEERYHVLDERFQALPPLGSDEYVRYLDAAPTQELPPEVLVRAFRQLPPSGTAARKTLERLFRRLPDGSWEYLEPMVRYAHRKGRSRKTDDEDLLQDGLTRILRLLSGKRGQRAEIAWNAYCRQEIVDAWRERYGRRGERCVPEDQVELSEERPVDPLDCVEVPNWHASLQPNNVQRIEEIAEQAIVTLPDEFVRQVAQAVWFRNLRPKVSGNGNGEQESLTSLFPHKSRFQLMRALRQADAQLAAALLTDPTMDISPDIQALLHKLGANSTRPSRMAKERKK